MKVDLEHLRTLAENAMSIVWDGGVPSDEYCSNNDFTLLCDRKCGHEWCKEECFEVREQGERRMKYLIFDTETTGTDVVRDRVIELCIVDWDTGEAMEWRFNPNRPIPAEATAVHGISANDLVGCPSFKEHAEELCSIFNAAEVFIGYNVQFDIDMVNSELERSGMKIDMSEKLIVQLWRQKEPRNLASAYARFHGGKLEGAHEAKADTVAAGKVLLGMIRTWEVSSDWAELAMECNPDRARYVGDTNHFVWKDDVAVFGFGKHKGKPILSNKGYLRWMQGQSFPTSVQDIIELALTGALNGR